MRHDFSQSLLRHILESIKVPIVIIASTSKLLNFIPDFVVVVAANPLCHVQLVGEVTEVDGSMVAEEEVAELKGVLDLRWVRRLNVLL